MDISIMAVWTEEFATDLIYPHINIYRKYRDGDLRAYEARVEDGYVFYDTTAEDTELRIDPESGVEIIVPITCYYIVRSFPATYNFANFSLVAVPRDSVDENYIFGGVGDNDHEVM